MRLASVYGWRKWFFHDIDTVIFGFQYALHVAFEATVIWSNIVDEARVDVFIIVTRAEEGLKHGLLTDTIQPGRNGISRAERTFEGTPGDT